MSVTTDHDVLEACLAGHPRATRELHRRFTDGARRTIAGFGFCPTDVCEIEQRLWTRLLTHCTAEDSVLRRYRGTGTLRAWIRRCAAREALGELRRRRVRRNVERADPVLPEASGDPELASMRSEKVEVLRAALSSAVGSLCHADQELLQLSLRGVPLRTMGADLGVDASTVSRRLRRVRQAVSLRTRRTLWESYGGCADELSLTGAELTL